MTEVSSASKGGKKAVCDGDGLENILSKLFKKTIPHPSTIDYTVELDDPTDGDELEKHKVLVRGIREATNGGEET